MRKACAEGWCRCLYRRLTIVKGAVHGFSLTLYTCDIAQPLLQVLLAMRANVEDRGFKGDCTPLMEASSAGHADIVRLLLTHNADVGYRGGQWVGVGSGAVVCGGGLEWVIRRG